MLEQFEEERGVSEEFPKIISTRSLRGILASILDGFFRGWLGEILEEIAGGVSGGIQGWLLKKKKTSEGISGGIPDRVSGRIRSGIFVRIPSWIPEGNF